MRLAYLDPHPVPGNATVPLQILQMVDAFGHEGAEVHLITPRPAQPLAPEQVLGHPISPRVRFHHLPNPHNHWWFPSGSNRPFFWLASCLLRTLAVDALFVRNIRLADRLLHSDPGSRPPLFFESHEFFANTFQENHPARSFFAQRKLNRLIKTEGNVCCRATGLIGTTALLVQDLCAAYPVSIPCLTAPGGFDARLAQQAESDPPPANPRPVILFLGNPHPWKGVEISLQAMQQVEGALLKIVGGRPERQQVLRHLAESLGVADRVELCPPVPPHQRFQVIRAADICLLPLSHRTLASRHTSPLKLFEYMAMGKPIITADLPSMHLLLEQGTHALLAEAENPDALAAAMRTLLDNPALANRLAAAAREKAQQHTWDQRARTILAFIAAQLPATGER